MRIHLIVHLAVVDAGPNRSHTLADASLERDADLEDEEQKPGEEQLAAAAEGSTLVEEAGTNAEGVAAWDRTYCSPLDHLDDLVTWEKRNEGRHQQRRPVH